MGQRGLADAGQIFNQQMAACEQTGQRQLDNRLFAENDGSGLFDDPVQCIIHYSSLDGTCEDYILIGLWVLWLDGSVGKV